jgi:hypothetical protein
LVVVIAVRSSLRGYSASAPCFLPQSATIRLAPSSAVRSRDRGRCFVGHHGIRRSREAYGAKRLLAGRCIVPYAARDDKRTHGAGYEHLRYRKAIAELPLTDRIDHGGRGYGRNPDRVYRLNMTHSITARRQNIEYIRHQTHAIRHAVIRVVRGRFRL